MKIDLHTRRKQRKGVSMLEMVIAGAMIAGVMTSLSLVMRTARQSWETVDSDYAALQQVHALMRHFVRAGRESIGVDSIAADGKSISLRTRDIHSDVEAVSTWTWTPDSTGSGRITYQHSDGAQSGLLAERVDAVTFVGYAHDGVTEEADPNKIQVVEIVATVTLPRAEVAQRVVRSKVWIRSW